MSRSGLFHEGEIGKPFIEANASMQRFLSRLGAESSRDSYSYAIYQYCTGIGKSPDLLLTERQNREVDPDGYKALDQAQQFILSGIVKTSRLYPSGKRHDKTTLIAELSRKRKELLYAAIKAFYKHNRAALPPETFHIVENHTDEQAIEPKVTYMPLAQAKATISACKTPYRELFSAMMYGGLGRREALLINKMWPQLVEQVKAAREPNEAIMLSYNFRKSQEQGYFTFIPAKVLTPFVNEPAPWMVRVHGGQGRKEAIRGWHYLKPWHMARKRAGIKETTRPHFFRDLMVTDGLTDAKINQVYLQFMTGHVVDKNMYLQLLHKPEQVKAEWMKWRAYVDAENPTLQGEVKAMTQQLTSFQEENKLLKDEVIVNLKEQLDMVQIAIAEDPTPDDPNNERMRWEQQKLINRLSRLGVAAEVVESSAAQPKPKPLKKKRRSSKPLPSASALPLKHLKPIK